VSALRLGVTAWANRTLTANERLATGRPATVDLPGGESDTESGHTDLIVSFLTIARTSSRAKTPPKLVA
jgi:hypothetical protein